MVDNNSTDQTRQVVQNLQRRYPELIRYVFEPKQGISNARNSGIAVAKGQILAFLDDDCEPEPGWAEQLATAYRTNVIGVAGPAAYAGQTVRSAHSGSAPRTR